MGKEWESLQVEEPAGTPRLDRIAYRKESRLEIIVERGRGRADSAAAGTGASAGASPGTGTGTVAGAAQQGAGEGGEQAAGESAGDGDWVAAAVAAVVAQDWAAVEDALVARCVLPRSAPG
jgi:hypothetical protein